MRSRRARYALRPLLAALCAGVLVLLPGVVSATAGQRAAGGPDGGSAGADAGTQAFDVAPARRALSRLAPVQEKQVTLRALPRTSGQQDRFTVSGRDGDIVVEG